MSRPVRLLRNVFVAIGALVLVLFIAAIIVVQTRWFQNYVKGAIVTAIEDGTGGRAEVGSFQFHWTDLCAVVDNLVIHGSEPEGSAVLLRVPEIRVYLQLFTSFQHWWKITAIDSSRPQANVIVYADGRTNLPTPRTKSSSNGSPLQTVVDLAIGHFEMTNGAFTFGNRKYQINARGNDLRAQLAYDTLKQDYTGNISLQPLYVVSGQNTPVDFTVRVPLVVARNSIQVKGASLKSARSTVMLDASVTNLRNPQVSATLHGRIALADLKSAGNLPVQTGANFPSTINLDASASGPPSNIQVSKLNVAVGDSKLQASGSLGSGINFMSRLSPQQIAGLTHLSLPINAPVDVNGVVKLNNHNLNVSDLRVSALGGELTGNASLQNFSTFRAHGDLNHLDLRRVLDAMNEKSLPYDGVLSGVFAASGSLKAPVLKQLQASADVAIAPGSRGVPVSGRLTASYNGARDDLTIQNSNLRLPHTQVSVNGSIGKELKVALSTTNLEDLLAAAPKASRPDIALEGWATFAGTVAGSLSSPRITGRVDANRLAMEGRRFDRVTADVAASKSGVAIREGSIRRDSMLASFSGSMGLHDWKTQPYEPVNVMASLQNADLADLLALAGRPASGYSGQTTGNLQVSGTFGNPRGSGSFTANNGSIDGQPFDLAQAQVNLNDQLATIPSAFIQSGAGRVNLTASYRHPRNSFTTGQLVAQVQSTQLKLAQLAALQKALPHTSGTIQLNAGVTADLSNRHFQLTSIHGAAATRGLNFQGKAFGNFSATANTTGRTVNYQVTSDFAGSKIQMAGDTELAPNYPTMARVTVANLPLQPVLALADRSDIPMAGSLSGTVNFNGTIANPAATAELNVSKGTLYGEAFDRIAARLNYLPTRIDIAELQLVSGPSRLDLTAQYDHAAGDFGAGNLRFNVAPSQIDLARVKLLTERVPGLGGHLQVAASGVVQVNAPSPRVRIQNINGTVAATGLAVNGKNLGNLDLSANTSAGRVNLALNSNLAGASIQGRGTVQLAAGYPGAIEMSFNNLTYSGVAPLLGARSMARENLEAAVDGKASVDGPLTDVQRLRGSFQLTRLQVSSKSSMFGASAGTMTEVLRNQGPISATVDRGVARIEMAHLTGPDTNIQMSGSIPLGGQAMKVAVNGNVNLAILQKLDRAITSSGQIAVAANIGGTLAHPALAGQVELRNASLDYVSSPTGIWKANGVILLTGDSALIRNVTAESGGGKVTLTGSASLSGTPRFDLAARATRVRLQVQPGLAIQISANITATGTSANSTISGNVILDQVYYGANTDLASILALSAPPVAPAPPSVFQQHMHLDVRVRAASSLTVQTSLAENLQLDADLRVRGTVATPGILGRIDITEGTLVFFGTRYTIGNGAISFYNPVRIEPVLDLSLNTQAQGVDVVVKVTGPFDNMKLSYSSNPPLQFQEIIALLATGATPTSDPTLLANQPSLPPQSVQQMGESALVGATVANPVSNQLQRVFGISQLKISPTFAGGSQLPQAQISLTQRITNNLSFTYVSGFNTANAQTIQAQWTFTPQWSAQALRDYNGIFSVTLTYKMNLH